LEATKGPLRFPNFSLFLPTVRFFCQLSQTDVTKLCEIVEVNRANKLQQKFGFSSPKKMETPEMFSFGGFFSTTSRFNGEYLRSEACYRQLGTALETTNDSLHFLEIL